MTKLYDTECAMAIIEGVNRMVPWYLMASYAYYILDKPILSDGMYDGLCKNLLDEVDQMNIDHPHIGLCEPDALRAGTAFHITEEEYPSIAKAAALRLLKE